MSQNMTLHTNVDFLYSFLSISTRVCQSQQKTQIIYHLNSIDIDIRDVKIAEQVCE